MLPDLRDVPALLFALLLVLIILLDRSAIDELLAEIERCQQRALCAEVGP